ncbi:hypothetical protein [Thiothrix nivea]|uniref:Uncharacterized protein n=1 Tax=Thiothrix nivea (strain ATCC 35100 / DSM 5205 / JP2) TaxID=870187 RepID=A0A656HHQ0_THINJ|nr:hypothetical protein [Thiothrix nivea]EIJ35732.1 hypothetical protein Thini_3211 [Thiothrix nivea DSM 5205]
MKQLILNLTDAEYDLLTVKAGNGDLQQIMRIAIDNYFCTHRHTSTNTPPLDLSGRMAILRKLATPEM